MLPQANLRLGQANHGQKQGGFRYD